MFLEKTPANIYSSIIYVKKSRLEDTIFIISMSYFIFIIDVLEKKNCTLFILKKQVRRHYFYHYTLLLIYCYCYYCY